MALKKTANHEYLSENKRIALKNQIDYVFGWLGGMGLSLFERSQGVVPPPSELLSITWMESLETVFYAVLGGVFGTLASHLVKLIRERWWPRTRGKKYTP